MNKLHCKKISNAYYSFNIIFLKLLTAYVNYCTEEVAEWYHFSHSYCQNFLIKKKQNQNCLDKFKIILLEKQSKNNAKSIFQFMNKRFSFFLLFIIKSKNFQMWEKVSVIDTVGKNNRQNLIDNYMLPNIIIIPSVLSDHNDESTSFMILSRGERSKQSIVLMLLKYILHITNCFSRLSHHDFLGI